MRPVFGIDSSTIRRLPASAALCVALALVALPAGVSAQESVTLEPLATAAQPAPDSANETFAATANVGTGPEAEAEAATAAEDESTRAQVIDEPDDGTPTSTVALDDQVLSRQRGGAAGMVMVAATPQLTRGNAVTLWDEIAPPSPLPIPVDAARAAQGNVANYQRK
ncbi:hypothetical protein [Paraburkholderia diazotrophica]|uniref:Uncharacterized protein n=1 Tax=Paraburkholderia diazotrophica TaxID=667676 RepID=A0A1H6ZJZ2_9BURK|nr:hypothetical protein [Paraburkholderia diazotrophica]SEJ50012.1 hypothetical protein SAMN05192539_101227 [Paraburkholderia diazotrophica]